MYKQLTVKRRIKVII